MYLEVKYIDITLQLNFTWFRGVKRKPELK